MVCRQLCFTDFRLNRYLRFFGFFQEFPLHSLPWAHSSEIMDFISMLVLALYQTKTSKAKHNIGLVLPRKKFIQLSEIRLKYKYVLFCIVEVTIRLCSFKNTGAMNMYMCICMYACLYNFFFFQSLC